MDDSKEGILLIATTMVVLVAFALTVLAVMIIYRKRKLQHIQEILEVQQRTMQYIGDEIHDNVGQQLSLAFLKTQKLAMENAGDLHTQWMAAIIDRSLTDLRNLASSLNDPNFMKEDLDQLIRQECDKVNGTGLYVVSFSGNVSGTEASVIVKNFVVRILQEFIQNSLKHSHCTTITVELSRAENGIQLNASDNGKGFIPDDKKHEGIGLRSMQKRASIIKASLKIDSSAQGGTSMKLFIPNHQLIINHDAPYQTSAAQYRHS